MGKIELDEHGEAVIIVPFQMRRLGRRQAIVLDCGKSVREIAKEPLPKAIIMAHQYPGMLESGKYATVLELAQKLKLDRSYVARTLNLVNLAPAVISVIMEGKAPENLTIARLHQGFPDNWQEQKQAFGMA